MPRQMVALQRWLQGGKSNVLQCGPGGKRLVHFGYIVEQAYVNAHNAGVLSFAAAGNSGTSAGTENNVAYPARYSSVIAVGATTSGDLRASFSCTGPTLEIAAPGAGIYSTLPGGRYGSYSGTSMACPHAVGAAAVLLQAARDYWGADAPTNDYIREIMAVSASDFGVAGRDPWYGWGFTSISSGLTAITMLGPAAPPPVEPPPPPTIRVSAVTYQNSGAKQRDLTITITVVDAKGVAVSGAAVNAKITCSTTATIYGGTVNTNASGKVTFKISNAPKGTWTTLLSSVTKSGNVWDGSKATTTFVRK